MKNKLCVIIGLLLYVTPIFSQNWNLVWREDFGVAEDTVIKDFADATKSLPRHSFARYESVAHYSSMGSVDYHYAGDDQGECGSIEDGQYGLTNSTWWAYNRPAACGKSAGHFVAGRDHTGNKNGAMLVVNSEVGVGEAIYQQEIEFNLCDSREYKFVIYAASITAYQDGGNAHLQLNVVNATTDQLIKSIDTDTIPFWSFGGWGSGYASDCAFCERNWTEYSCTFTANNGDKLRLEVVNYGSGYNDFAIDDISLYRNDDVDVIDPSISTNTISSASTKVAGSCIYTAAFEVPEEILTNWKKIYDKVYFLWQKSDDDGLTWNNVTEVSGIEKLAVEIEVSLDKTEVYRVIITGSSTEALAEQQALYIAEHGGPNDGCSYFSISNTLAGVSPTPDCSFKEDARSIWSEDFGVVDSFSTREYDAATLTYYETNKEGLSKGNYVVVSIPEKAIKKANYSWDGSFSDYSYDQKDIRDASGKANGAMYYTYFGKATGTEADDMLFNKTISGPYCSCKNLVFSFLYYDQNEWAGEELKIQVVDDSGDVLGLSSVSIGHDQSRAWNRQLTPFTIPNGYTGDIHLQIINMTPSNDWNYIAFDDMRIDVCGESVPQGTIQIDADPTASFLGGFDCNEEPLKTISVVDDSQWKKYYPSFGIAWQTSTDGGLTWNYLSSDKTIQYDNPDGGLVEYRLVFAETAEAAVQTAMNGKPNDPCLIFGYSNRVGLQCEVQGCKAPVFTINGDTITDVCSTDFSSISVEATQQNKVNVDEMQWYSKSFDESTWTPISGATTAILTISTLPADSTDYLFIARNDTCYSDSIQYRLNVHTAISLQPLEDTVLCAGADFTVETTALTGVPTSYVWSNDASVVAEQQTLSALSADVTLSVYATDGVCTSDTENMTITVEQPIVVTPLTNLTVCEGTSIEIEAEATGTIKEIKWSHLDLNNDSEALALTDAGPYKTVAERSDVYTIEFVGNKCKSETVQQSVTVQLLPTVTVSTSSDTVCAGDAVSLTGTVDNASSYSWMSQAENETSASQYANQTTSGDLSWTAVSTTKLWVMIPTDNVCPEVLSDTLSIVVEQPLDYTIDAVEASICAGNSIQLNASFVQGNPSAYGWRKNADLIASDLSTSDMPTELTTYEFFANSAYCPSFSKTFNVDVETSSDLTISCPDTLACSGSTIQLQADFGTALTVEWQYSVDNVNFTTFSTDLVTSKNFELENYEAYYFRLKTAGSGACPNVYSSTIKVRVEVPLELNFPTVPKVCEGTSINFNFTDMTDEQKNNYTYEWSDGSSVLSTDAEYLAYVTESVDLSVKITSKVCPEITHTYSVEVQSVPRLSISTDKSKICQGETAVLTVDYGAATALNWKSISEGVEQTISSDLINQQSVTPNKSTRYWVEFPGDEVCTSRIMSDTLAIDVEDSISFTLSSVQPVICAGDAVSITASQTAGLTSSHAWTINGVSSSTDYTLNDSPTQTAEYTFTIYGDVCPAASKSVTVEVEKSADLTLTASQTAVCQGTDVALTATYGESTSLSWESSQDGIAYTEFATDLTTDKTVTPAVTTHYRLKTIGTGACKQVFSTPVEVMVEDSIQLSVTPVASVICEGESLQLSATIMAGQVVSQQWSANGILLANNLMTTNQPVEKTQYTFVAQGTYCPTVEKSFEVDVEKRASLLLSTSDEKICAGNAATLSATYSNNNSLLWQSSTDGVSFTEYSSDIVATSSVSPSITTFYQLKTDGTGACPQVTSDAVKVEVEQPVSVVLPTSSAEGCPGQTFTLQPTIGGSPLSIAWYSKSESQTDFVSMGISQPELSVVPSQSVVYKIEATADKCDNASAELNYTVSEIPTLDIQSDADRLCEGDAVSLNTTFPYTPNLIWSSKKQDETGFTTIATGVAQLFETPDETITYKVSATTEKNCPAGEKIIEIKVDKAVNITLEDKTICKGDSVTLRINGLDEYETIQWSNGTAATQNNAKPSATTDYMVTVQNGLCKSEATSQVTVVNAPTIVSCEEISIKTYEVIVESDLYPLYYDYDNGIQSSSNLLENVSYGKSYTITVSNELGCASSYVLETPTYEISIPTYFNPDSKTWKVENLERYAHSVVKIYDRFGKQLVELEGSEMEGWDGTYQGNKMPSTDYWYVITIGEIDKVYTGHFTLIR